MDLGFVLGPVAGGLTCLGKKAFGNCRFLCVLDGRESSEMSISPLSIVVGDKVNALLDR